MCLCPCLRSKSQGTFEEGCFFCQAAGEQITPSLWSGRKGNGTFSGALPRTTPCVNLKGIQARRITDTGGTEHLLFLWDGPSPVSTKSCFEFLRHSYISSLLCLQGKSSHHPGISFPKIQLQSPFKWFLKKKIIFKKYCTAVTNFTTSCFFFFCHMFHLRFALTNFFSSPHGMGRLFSCAFYMS